MEIEAIKRRIPRNAWVSEKRKRYTGRDGQLFTRV